MARCVTFPLLFWAKNMTLVRQKAVKMVTTGVLQTVRLTRSSGTVSVFRTQIQLLVAMAKISLACFLSCSKVTRTMNALQLVAMITIYGVPPLPTMTLIGNLASVLNKSTLYFTLLLMKQAMPSA